MRTDADCSAKSGIETVMNFRPLCAIACVGLALSWARCDIAAARSATACDNYARNYARNASREGQVIGRGAVGSLLGAGIGAAFGGAGTGAAIGGGIGVLSGGSSRRKTADRMYHAAYKDCMAGRVP
jgi:hypothetical protein